MRTIDFPKVVADWPGLRFCAYHSGYFQEGDHPLGLDGLTEFLQVVSTIPPAHRRRVYAEIGSTFAVDLASGPEKAAHLVGQLLQRARSAQHPLGHRLDLVGLAAVADRRVQDAADPPGDARAVRLSGAHRDRQAAHPRPERGEPVPASAAARAAAPCPPTARAVQAEQGGLRADRSLRVYGARTRREFLKVFS